MRGSRIVLVVLSFLALCLLTLGTQAQVVKKAQAGLDDLVAVSPRLAVPANVLPAEDIRVDATAMAAPVVREVTEGWDRFISENGSQWQLMVDRRTGRPALVSGSGIPWVPGAGNALQAANLPGGQVSRGAVVKMAKQFIRSYPELFGVDPSELQVIPESTGQFGGYLWYVHFQRTFYGIPVEKSYVVFRVNNGNLIQFGGEFLGAINLDPLPSITAGTAREIVAGYVGGLDGADTWVNRGSLTVLPLAPVGDVGTYTAAPGDGVDYHLVYTVAFKRDGQMGTWEAKVDAHTGEILSFRDANEYGSVKGGVYINSNLDTEVVRPFAFANVGTSVYADKAGNYSATSGTVTSTLAGKYVKVTDSCGSISLSATAPADLNFSTSSGTDCTNPGVGGSGNTHASRTQYYHATLWKMKAQAWLPSNTWLTGQVTDKVNLNQTCNAYWDGSAVNFFKSGGGCSNTGELPTVSLHELGHGLDDNDGSPSSTVGSSESYGDIQGLLATHASCVGINFIPGQQCSGYGNACTNCTGIRDADYTKHTYSTSPAKPSQLSATSGFHCSKSSSYPGPCGYEGHCESYIMSEAGWDLAANTTYGLPSKSGMTTATAWFLADRLFYLTRPTAGDSYTCPTVTTANGCGTSNWFMVYLAADDDDGNLSNGTPHGAEIYKAFNLHGIACSTYSTIVDSGCSSLSTTAPTLTATAGSGSVSLSWSTVSGATGYYILRNEISSTAGMLNLATTTGTTYTDSLVVPGITYYYSIVGYTGTPNRSGGGGSCIGTLATVKSATPSAGATYSISGTVSGATASGVTMSLTGASTATTTTDTSGNYTFSGLANGSYTVTPSKSGYTFSPTSIAVTISGANQTGKNFTATATSGDTPLTSGVGVSTGSITKGAYKYYTIVVPSGATNLTVTLTNLTADLDLYVNNSTTHPTTSSYYGRSWNSGTTSESLSWTSPTVTTWCIGIYGYAAGSGTVTATVTMPTQTYSISGTVSGATASGVTMSLTGAATATTTTDTSGNYTFSGLANGSYTVTPSKSGYTFSPTSIAVTVSGANQTGKNFTATAAATYSISGTVSGATASGVSMSLTGAATATTTTDTSGNYTFSGLVNGSYTVTPSKSGYTFSPTSIAVTISGANQTGKNFTATAGGTETTLFTNGFESSTGWAQVDTSGTAGSWSRVTSGTYPTCSRHSGSYMAKFNSYTASSGSATRYYRTSSFAISSSYTTVTLKFWMYHDTGYSTYADKIQPQVSTNGSTWTSVGSAINRYDGSTGWKEHTVSITTYKGSSVYLGLLATSAYGNNMYVDDVTVVAQ